MLNGIYVNVAAEMAVDLFDLGPLQPIPESPFAVLYKQIDPFLSRSRSVGGDEVGKNVATAAGRIDDFGNNEHDRSMAAIVEKVSTIVSRNRSLARMQAIPMLEQAKTTYSEEMAAYRDPVLTPLIMTPVFYSDIWSNDAFMAMVGEMISNVKPTKATASVNIGGEFIIDRVLEGITTGISEIDASLLPWAKDVLGKNGWNVYCMFSIDGSSVSKMGAELTQEERIDVVALSMLIANNLSDIIEGNTKLPLDSIRVLGARIRDGLAELLKLLIHAKSTDLQYGRLLRRGRYNATVDHGAIVERVSVSGEVLNDIVNDGIAVEAVMGAILNKSLSTKADLKARSAEYIKIYNNRCVTGKIRARDEFIRHRMRAIINTFKKLSVLSSPTGDRDALYSPQIVDEKLRNELFKKWMLEERYSAISDDHVLMRELVCDVFFPDTNVKFILTEMDSPEYDGIENPNEVAVLVVCDMYARWVVGQISCG